MKDTDILEVWAMSEFSREKLKELHNHYPENERLLLAEKVLLQSNRIKPRLKAKNDYLWLGIIDKIEKEAKVVPLFAGRAKWIMIAATVSLLLVAAVVFKLLEKAEVVTHHTVWGQNKSLNLPNGSKIFMNAESTISYNPSDWNDHRKVELSGEAFFEVKEGAPFSVSTDSGIISVLGTSFNVKLREGELTVGCKTGKVNVQSGATKTLLTPGEIVVVSSGGIHNTLKKGSEKTDTWRSGQFLFNNAHPSKVLAEIERQFGYRVVLKKSLPLDLRYNGFFHKNSIDQAMKNVCIPLGISFEIDHSKKTIEVEN